MKLTSNSMNALSLGVICSLTLFTQNSQAALTWTGAVSNALYTEGNWLDDTNAIPAANTINGLVAVSATTGGDIIISSGPTTPSNSGSSFLVNNNNLTVSGGKTLNMTSATDGDIIAKWATATGQDLTISGGGTISAKNVRNFNSFTVDDGTFTAAGALSGQSVAITSGISILNGSSFTVGNIGLIYDEVITVDSTSSLSVTTTTATPFASVDLALGAQLTLSSEAYFTTHGSRILVNGVSYADDSSILSFSGTTATAVLVPEPSSTALLGLSGLALIMRRRKG